MKQVLIFASTQIMKQVLIFALLNYTLILANSPQKKFCYNLSMPKKKPETKTEKAFHQELLGQLLTLSTSGFGLVAALAWNETIQQFVKDFVEPKIPGSGLLSKLIYAILITLLAVIITFQLSRLASRFQRSKS